MTLNVFVSFSLLALSVTARPIQPSSNDFIQVDVQPSFNVLNVLQSVFQSHVGPAIKYFGYDNERLQMHSEVFTEENHAVLSELDELEAIKALVSPSDEAPRTDNKQQFYELPTGPSSVPSASVNSPEGAVLLAKNLEPVYDTMLYATDDAPERKAFMTSPNKLASRYLVTLYLACLAASMALGSLLGMLYLKYLLNGNDIGSEYNTPDALSIEKQKGVETATYEKNLAFPSDAEKLGLLFLDVDIPSPGGILVEKNDAHLDANEEDELFHDTEPFLSSPTPHIYIEDADPPLPPLAAHSPTPTPCPIISPDTPSRPLRRLPSHLSLITKPARPLHPTSPKPPTTPLPGTYTPDTPDTTTPTIRPAPRRAHRAHMPELDLAFALQLRPSFGAGAGTDAAWCVRFLVVMLGWMTMWVGGGRGSRRAITAV